MKRVLAVLLSVVLVFGLLPVYVFAADKDLSVLVAADLQVSYIETTSGPQERNDTELYNSAYGLSPVMFASKAILEEFLSQAAESDAKIILIAGDLANGGFDGTDTEPDYMITEAEERALAERFSIFESQTGKKVFVIDGDRDVCEEFGNPEGITARSFKNIWRDVCYNDAYAVDPNSCSYTADLDQNYRLIAIDAMSNEQSVMTWVEQQADLADEQGKKLIGLMHSSAVTHVPYVMADKQAFEDNTIPVGLSNFGIKYMFTGDTGCNDVASYSFSGSQALYDVCTGSLCAYPSCYRSVVFGKTVQFNTKYITSIDTEYVRGSDQMNEALSDSYEDYIKSFQAAGLKAYFDDMLTVKEMKEVLRKKLSMRPDYYPNLYETLPTTLPALNAIINKPLYGDSGSLAYYASQYGTELPEGLEYDTYLAALIDVIQQVIHGDENVYSSSDLGKLILQGGAVCINYSLSALGEDDFLKVLDDIARRVSIQLPENVRTYAADPVNRQLILNTVADGAAVMLDAVAVDVSPSDAYNYNMVGYDIYNDAPVQTAATILERIANFFNAIINFFRNLFSRFG